MTRILRYVRDSSYMLEPHLSIGAHVFVSIHFRFGKISLLLI